MKVFELIKRLQELDPDQLVMIRAYLSNNVFIPLKSAVEVGVGRNQYEPYKGCYVLEDLDAGIMFDDQAVILR